MATFQQQPLPPGYEARWDPNQKAYFFINHYTKTTTWEDPRVAQHAGARQALNQPTSTPQARETIPLSDVRNYGRSANANQDKGKETNFIQRDSTVKSELISRFPSCPESVIDLTMSTHHNKLEACSRKLIQYGYQRKRPKPNVTTREDITVLLQKQFPSAVGVIPDVLRNTEAEAVAALEGLGFTPASATSHLEPFSSSHGASSPRHSDQGASSPRRTASPTHQPSRKAASPIRQPSPSRRSPAHQAPPKEPEPEPEPVLTVLSDAEKARLKRTLNVEYSHIGEYLVSMALEACDYNEDNARAVLDTGLGELKDDNRESRPSTAASSRPSTSHSTASNSTAVSERTLTPAPAESGEAAASLEPVAFTMNEDMMPEKPASASSKGSVKQNRQSSTKQPQHKPNHVTKMSEQLLTTTNDMLNHLSSTCCPSNTSIDQSDSIRHVPKTTTPGVPVVTQPRPTHQTTVRSQPTASNNLPKPAEGTRNNYRTTPVGPDPTLRHGPDPTFRSEREVIALGPDPTLRQGADPERRIGSQGFNGPDPSLRCGPMNLGSNQRLLVTSI